MIIFLKKGQILAQLFKVISVSVVRSLYKILDYIIRKNALGKIIQVKLLI